MAKADGAATVKAPSSWKDPYGTWGVIFAFYWSVQSAASLYNGIRAHHGIASLVFWALMVFYAPNVLWQRRRLRLRQELGIPDPAPTREGHYVPSMMLPMFALVIVSYVLARVTGSPVAWVVVGLLAFGLVHLIGVSAVVGDQSVTIRNGQFRRRRTVRYSEIASLRMVHPSYPFTRSRLLEIGLNGGETVRVLGISDDPIARSDVWTTTVPSAEDRKVARGPLLGKICEHTGLSIQTGVPR